MSQPVLLCPIAEWNPSLQLLDITLYIRPITVFIFNSLCSPLKPKGLALSVFAGPIHYPVPPCPLNAYVQFFKIVNWIRGLFSCKFLQEGLLRLTFGLRVIRFTYTIMTSPYGTGFLIKLCKFPPSHNKAIIRLDPVSNFRRYWIPVENIFNLILSKLYVGIARYVYMCYKGDYGRVCLLSSKLFF